MSPPSDRSGSKSTGNSYELVLSNFPDDLASRLNVDQVFILIDGVLPFEACLYHQVLPLYLEGSRLHLGMVSPDDQTASDYARRIVSYLNYSLVTQSISSAALQAVLSAYLNYVSNRQTGTEAADLDTPIKTKDLQPQPSSENSNQSDRQTLIVDSPDDLESMDRVRDQAHVLPSLPPPQTNQASPAISPPATSPPAISPPATNSPVVSPPVTPTPAMGAPTPSPAAESGPISAARRASLLNNLPVLQINPQHRNSPVEVLRTLPPQQLLKELLGRILEDGIGRLYFERQSHHGRVLWSQNGVLQSIMEHIDLSLLHGLVAELKVMAHMPAAPLQAPQQVEIERSYQQNRILLRFRVMPSKHGEEATVQVLRGAALKFYQQQQLSRLGRDALSIAKQLQFKVNEIRERALSEPGLVQARMEALASLSDMLRTIEHQVEDLQSVDLAKEPSPPTPPNPPNSEETFFYDA
ncbi:MAG: hypothetical protein EA367_17885 [Leptolyngbya sp. DLM2.Bin15]|nr:MAG: hypothetical protein EA367_17885 [Leptolyngbya sp. DLM2.Bin15]